MANTQITDVADQTFDYVIVGGGTAGLTLASRLSEDPSVTVAVLEAGRANLDDPNILVPAQFGKTFFNPQYDWIFHTTKQKHMNDKTTYWPRGKALGGSSTMNFLCWTKPCAQDVNAFETLGNKGWNWESFVKYSQRSETFNAPTKEQLDILPATFNPKNYGKSGPIQTSIPHHVHTVDQPFRQTLNRMGLPTIPDAFGGDITGTWVCPSNIDPKTHTRSYAATAYYQQSKDRRNFTVLTEALVSRVIFGDIAAQRSPNDDVKATGVEFQLAETAAHNAKSYVVHARKEVILSAGAVKDPQILELSGIGRKEVLGKLGIVQTVDLPGVGENVQEHLHADMTYELDDKIDHKTLDMLRDPHVAAEQMTLHASKQGAFRTGITAFAYFPLSHANPQAAPKIIDKVVKDLDAQKASGSLPPGLEEQYALQLDVLKDDAIPDIQLIPFPGLQSLTYTPVEGKKHLTMMAFLNHPFSRGTIHAISTDPAIPPEIDPHFFENDFDLELLVQGIKYIRSMTKVEPWKSTAVREVEPGPECSTDEDIREYVKNTASPVYHTGGSCSMLPRENQGVVDSKLKVYGTQNLRVVDISIIPLHVATHTQSMAYFIAEKAADIILGRV